jgi:hypothetical protein
MFNVAELVERRSARAFPGPHRLVTLAAIQLYSITPLPAVLGHPPRGVGNCLGFCASIQAGIKMLIFSQCQLRSFRARLAGRPYSLQKWYLSFLSSGD